MVISAPGMIFGLTLASIAFHCTLFLLQGCNFIKQELSSEFEIFRSHEGYWRKPR